MKNNTLLFLAFALVIALGASFWLTRDTQTESLATQPLLGSFAEQLESLQSLELRTQNQVLFAAQKLESDWFATHLSNSNRFPVNLDALSDFIGELNQAELLEAKTQNAENYSRLGVEDLVVENAQSTLLTLQANNTNFELLIGNASSNGFGSFVRRPASKQSWQLDRVLSLPTDQQSWLQNPVLEVSSSDIVRAELLGKDGWTMTKAGDDFQLEDMQEAESLIYPTVLSNALTAMLELKFDQVQPRVSTELPEAANFELAFETANGALTVRVFTQEQQHWITYEFAQQAWLAEWVFGISEFSHGQLVKLRSDFIESPEVTEEDPQP